MQYKLKQLATLISGESGEIIGRAEYTTGQPSYMLRYVAKDGRLTEAWWTEDAIMSANDPVA